jgi:hypothetical protein
MNIENLLHKKYIKAQKKLSRVKTAKLLSTGTQQVFLLSYLGKVNELFEEIWSEECSLQSSIACIRFILEALVKTERFLDDKEYLNAFFTQYLDDQINSLNNLKERLVKDISLLEKYINKSEKLSSIITFKSGSKTSKEASEAVKHYNKEEDKLYDELEKEFSVFLDATGVNGFSFQKYVLEKGISQISKAIKDAKEKIIKNKIKSPKFLRIKEEFKKYGFKDEYDFIYSYTSDLIHCRSYSIYSPIKLDINEELMIKSMSIKFVNRIADNLVILGKLPENCEFLDLTEGFKSSKIDYKTTASKDAIKKWINEFGCSDFIINETLNMAASPDIEKVFFKNKLSKLNGRYIYYKDYELFRFILHDAVNEKDCISFSSIEDAVASGWVLD